MDSKKYIHVKSIPNAVQEVIFTNDETFSKVINPIYEILKDSGLSSRELRTVLVVTSELIDKC